MKIENKRALYFTVGTLGFLINGVISFGLMVLGMIYTLYSTCTIDCIMAVGFL